MFTSFDSIVEPFGISRLALSIGDYLTLALVFFGLLLLYGLIALIVPLLFQRESRPAASTFFRKMFPAYFWLVLLGTVNLYFSARFVGAVPMVDRILPPLIVLVSAALVHGVSSAFFVILRQSFDLYAEDNLRARKVTTQIVVLQRVVAVVIYAVGLSIAIMTVPEIRRYGTSLLASAGIAGLILGLAAQQTLSNVLAGVQIAITQPLRIDDAVVIDGEWGRVEEITLTYVVVRIWDLRRLVVPISYLLQKPFQNWTRTSSSIIGSVFLYVDYTTDLSALRTEQTKILTGSDLWDGNTDLLQVTDATEQSIQIRSVVSASDSGKAWELRCLLREGLVSFLKREQPEALPRRRMKIQGTLRSTAATGEARKDLQHP